MSNSLLSNPVLLLAMLMTLFVIFEGFIIALCFIRVPNLPAILFGQRLVFEIGNDGRMLPKKATLEGDSYRTKDGLYRFEKEDVVYFKGKPSILVVSPYSKAIRPRIMEVFRLLKEKNVYRVREFRAILEADEVSYAEYLEMIKKPQKKQKEVLTDDEDTT